jgi:hypothetical protein
MPPLEVARPVDNAVDQQQRFHCQRTPGHNYSRVTEGVHRSTISTSCCSSQRILHADSGRRDEPPQPDSRVGKRVNLAPNPNSDEPTRQFTTSLVVQQWCTSIRPSSENGTSTA